jgi:transposase
MKKVGAILKLNKAGKYFEVKTKDSLDTSVGFVLEYWTNTEKIQSDQRLDGTFVIQTNHLDYEGDKLVKIYKNLNKVENAFRIIKNDLDIRPMYHRKEVRIKGHVYVCVLACFMMTAIEYIAQKKKINTSARKILRKLSKLGLIEIGLPNGETRYSTTTISEEQQAILKSFGIKKLSLPNVV